MSTHISASETEKKLFFSYSSVLGTPKLEWIYFLCKCEYLHAIKDKCGEF